MFFWAVVAVLAGAVGGCEVVPTGDAVVTWRFNGQPIHQTDKPCKVFNAGGFGSNQGVVEIAFDGPEPFTDRAACASRVSDYPLALLNAFRDVPRVYARAFYDVPEGHYFVTLRFFDRKGTYVEAIGEVSGELEVERGQTVRLDLDVPLDFGRLDVRWQVAGGCEALGAVATEVALVAAGSGERLQERFTCSDGDTDATPFTPVEPGDYETLARLLGESGQPLTNWKSGGTLTVTAGEIAEASLAFDASDLL